MRRIVDILTALVLIVAVLVVAARLREEPIVDAEGPFRAVDGDSLESATQRLRLRGIDAPELRQMCGADETVPCGRNARSALAVLTRSGIVCRIQGTDRFGRGLATCETKTGADVARTLVLAGHAVADGCCSAEEKLAQERKAGIWATSFQRPDEWRATRQDSESRSQEP
jgi:endonuclease YncB( thermonuclease family)